MKTEKQYFKILPAFLIALFISTPVLTFAQLTGAGIVVLRVGSGASQLNTTSQAVFLDVYDTATANQSSPSSTVTIPNTLGAGGSTARLSLAGTTSNAPEGEITLSTDGNYIVLAGYDTSAGLATVSSKSGTIVARKVDTINTSGTVGKVDTTQIYMSFSAFNCAIKGSGNNYWIGGNNSTNSLVYFGFGSTRTRLVTQEFPRFLRIMSGDLYFSNNFNVPGIYRFSGTPTSTASVSTTTGDTIITSNAPIAFDMNDARTVCYFTDNNTTSGKGGVYKMTRASTGIPWGSALVTRQWCIAFSEGLNDTGAVGLAVDWTGPHPILYVTTSENDTGSGNNLVRIVDTVTLTGGTRVKTSNYYTVLAHANKHEVFRGVSFLPNHTKVWIGGTSTTWTDQTNWLHGVVPISTDDTVVITSGTNQPDFGTRTYTFARLEMDSNTTLAIGSGGKITLTGDSLIMNGTVSGSGSIVMNGSTAQGIRGTGTISNLELNNSNGATITSGSRINISNAYTPTSGTLTTNGNLTLLSTSASTAASILQGSSSGSYISGNVTIQRYIPGGQRAVRFFAHPFSSSIGLTQLEDNIDVTGSGGSTNGFTTTATNSPSAFWYNAATGTGATSSYDSGWTAYTSTDSSTSGNAWAPYEGIRVLVRGSKGQAGSLTGGTYTPNAVTIDMAGPVNQGDITVSMTEGAATPFYFTGNPFPCPVDLSSTTSRTNVDANFYVWNPSTGTHGAYETNPWSSSYILPAYAGFFVHLSGNGSITFPESAKSTSSYSSTLFRKTAGSLEHKVELKVYSNHDSLQWDRLTFYFDTKGKSDSDWYDGAKLFNPDMSFYSFSTDHTRMALDVRPMVDSQVIPLGIMYAPKKNYTLKVTQLDLPAGGSLLLHDKYLGVEQTLTLGAEYAFSITADSNSQGDNRFELNSIVAPAGVGTANAFSAHIDISPNPTSDHVMVNFAAPDAGNATIRVITLTGKEVLNLNLGHRQTGSTTLSTQSLAPGIYILQFSCGNYTASKQLIKK